MANQSIYTAFERMWHHIIAKLGTKSDVDHTHNDIYYTESEMDVKINEINESVSEAKSYADTKDSSILEESKLYTDNATSQKTQVQIITWGDDD